MPRTTFIAPSSILLAVVGVPLVGVRAIVQLHTGSDSAILAFADRDVLGA